MAQTIAEKLAEKYAVTPSTTIAGTLKKITKDETGDVNIASLVGKMEAGGGGDEPKRVLLYENDALDISQTSGDWIFGQYQNEGMTNACFNTSYPGNWILSVDNEELIAPLQIDTSSGGYYLGVLSPSDSEHVGVNKIGCRLSANHGSYIQNIVLIMLDKNYFTAGTHSVKIYKEV